MSAERASVSPTNLGQYWYKAHLVLSGFERVDSRLSKLVMSENRVIDRQTDRDMDEIKDDGHIRGYCPLHAV